MNTRLYVGNLSFETTEEGLRTTFAQHGEVLEVKVVMDRDTGRSRGFAFVTMDSPTSAKNALDRLNGTNLDGRSLRVDEAEERQRGGGGGGGGGGGRGGYSR